MLYDHGMLMNEDRLHGIWKRVSRDLPCEAREWITKDLVKGVLAAWAEEVLAEAEEREKQRGSSPPRETFRYKLSLFLYGLGDRLNPYL